MAIASITVVLLLIPTSTFVLVFPICQEAFAQSNETLSAEAREDIQNRAMFNTIIAAISGALVGAAATLIGTYLNNRHSMNVKKQELKHDLGIELLKHRIECYESAFKLIERFGSQPQGRLEFSEIRKLLDQLKEWYIQGKGGLLMSENSSRMYKDLKKVMEETLEPLKRPGVGMGPLILGPERGPIIRSAGELRLSSQRDLGVSDT